MSDLRLFDVPPVPEPAYTLRVIRVPNRAQMIFCAHVDRDGEGAHWRHEGEPCPLEEPADTSAIDRAFRAFDEANPAVYRLLVTMARDLVARGHRTLGIGMLFEVARWHWMSAETTDPASKFKLNNNYRSRYARLIMDTEPDLAGVFEVRELQS